MELSVKKIFNFLKSMKFGLILLGILCLVSVIGSVIPQGREEAFYLSTYSSLWAEVILAFNLNDIYHSTGFILLFSALSLNLLLCSTLRLKSVLHKMSRLSMAPIQGKLKNPVHVQKYYAEDTIYDIFKDQGFKNILYEKNEATEIYHSSKNKMGYWGSWLIHVGILAVIVFYGYGQYTFVDTAVYGVPGSVQEVEGTDYVMHIEDFNIRYREDGSVEQYITEAVLKDQEGNSLVSGEIYVNNPMRHDGYTFYQHSTGWASEIHVAKDNAPIGNDVIYEGTAYINNEEFIIIQMHHLYPDFVATEEGFATKSNDLNNPKVLYSVLYGGNRVDMNVVSPGEEITWENYRFSFTNPQRYTYLSANKMQGKIGAMVASLIIMLGLFLAFYMKPKKLIVERKNDRLYLYGNYSLTDKNTFKPTYPHKKDISI